VGGVLEGEESVRTLIVALLPVALAAAREAPGIDWATDWNAAFAEAVKSHRPVMVCINSKDGERANETTAHTIYHDPVFVALSRQFVMVLVSTREHAAEGPCPRFGKVTCAQHLECWKELKTRHGDKFCLPGTDEMISPQHAWFSPEGKLLQRKEYFLGKSELMRRMRTVLKQVGPPKDGGGAQGSPAPLDEADRAALAHLAEAEDPDTRSAALGHLLGTGKAAAYGALCELAAGTKDEELKGDLVLGLARAQVAAVRPVAEKLLADRDELVRSQAAVALEELGLAESVAALVRRVHAEDDPTARKNACRALGACGGPAADKDAAKALLRVLEKDKQKSVAKHAGLALAAFAGDGAELVRKKLEHAARDAKERDLQFAMVYALAYVGTPKTTVPVLEKILADERDQWAQAFLKAAIAKVQAGDAGADDDPFAQAAAFLFWEDRDDPARTE